VSGIFISPYISLPTKEILHTLPAFNAPAYLRSHVLCTIFTVQTWLLKTTLTLP
jgi:hypothetical protein